MHNLWNPSNLSLKWVCNPTHNYILNFNFHHLLSEFKIYPKLVPCSQSPTVEIIYHIFNRIIFWKHSSDYAISSPKILKASLCLPDKIWSPYMVFKTLYNAAPVSLFCLPFSTIPQALAILCYLLIPKHAHSSPPEPLHIMFSCLNVLPFITRRKKSYFSFSFSSEKFPSLWRPVTTNIQIISLFFVFQEHYHAMSTPLIVLK